MGTNFYKRGYRYSDNPEKHIGKRSAAGMYCWDCGLTLCAEGEAAAHFGRAKWHSACPKCHASAVQESLNDGAVGRELGFNKSAPKRKSGVSSACSFTWAMLLEQRVFGTEPNCPCCQQVFNDPEKVIEDEYGNLYTLEEFAAVLDECPIQYGHEIGRCFS